MSYDIPIPEGDGEIPDINAVSQQQEEAPEVKPFSISFDDQYYKHKECQAHGMSKVNGATALKVIRDIGVYFTDQSNFSQNSLSYLEIKYVHNNGKYERLYKKLDVEDEIYEIKCVRESKSIDFRIFFTLNTLKRVFHVIAIRESHYSTD